MIFDSDFEWRKLSVASFIDTVAILHSLTNHIDCGYWISITHDRSVMNVLFDFDIDE
jgi:hypothetical protein